MNKKIFISLLALSLVSFTGTQAVNSDDEGRTPTASKPVNVEQGAQIQPIPYNNFDYIINTLTQCKVSNKPNPINLIINIGCYLKYYLNKELVDFKEDNEICKAVWRIVLNGDTPQFTLYSKNKKFNDDFFAFLLKDQEKSYREKLFQSSSLFDLVFDCDQDQIHQIPLIARFLKKQINESALSQDEKVSLTGRIDGVYAAPLFFPESAPTDKLVLTIAQEDNEEQKRRADAAKSENQREKDNEQRMLEVNNFIHLMRMYQKTYYESVGKKYPQNLIDDPSLIFSELKKEFLDSKEAEFSNYIDLMREAHIYLSGQCAYDSLNKNFFEDVLKIGPVVTDLNKFSCLKEEIEKKIKNLNNPTNLDPSVIGYIVDSSVEGYQNKVLISEKKDLEKEIAKVNKKLVKGNKKLVKTKEQLVKSNNALNVANNALNVANNALRVANNKVVNKEGENENLKAELKESKELKQKYEKLKATYEKSDQQFSQFEIDSMNKQLGNEAIIATLKKQLDERVVQQQQNNEVQQQHQQRYNRNMINTMPTNTNIRRNFN